MHHNRDHVAELLSRPRVYDDCGCNGHHDHHSHGNILDITSPIDGQILQYSEQYRAFINTTINMDFSSISGGDASSIFIIDQQLDGGGA